MKTVPARPAVAVLATLLAGGVAPTGTSRPKLEETTMEASVPAARSAADANKALVAGIGEAVFNRHDLSALDRVRPDYIQHNPLVPQGREGFRSFLADTFEAVPDWGHETRKVAAEGDLVWVYGTYRGTHRGEWLGIPATGKSFAVDAIDIFRVEDGQLAEHWDVMDVYGLFRQLGVVR